MSTRTINRRCPFCGSPAQITVDESEYQTWLAGTPAQSAFPDLTPNQRERLISGICPACWRHVLLSEDTAS